MASNMLREAGWHMPFEGRSAMKSVISALAAIFLSLAGFTSDARARSHAQDEQEIAALLDQYAAAVNAKDISGLMKLCAPDVFVFDVFVPRQYVGVAAYRKDWEGILAYKNFNLSIGDLSITTDGTLAYSHSINRTSGIAPDGKAFEINSRVTDAFRKINGHWIIVMEHWSFPVDPSTGQADLASRP
jgi:ketosteroid isomerase-like protein